MFLKCYCIYYNRLILRLIDLMISIANQFRTQKIIVILKDQRPTSKLSELRQYIGFTAIMSTIGIPIKLLHECQGHIITVELSNGDIYRGKLHDAEDNCNVQLKEVGMTARNGQVRSFKEIFIRGSHVRFFVVPEMLRNAPIFNRGVVRGIKGGTRGGRRDIKRENDV